MPAIGKFDALKPWVVASDLAAGTKATRALIEKVKASSPDAHKDHVLFLLGKYAGLLLTLVAATFA